MARVKGGSKTKRRRKKWLKLAKGYVGKRGSCYRVARVSVMKGLAHSYRGRKEKKRTKRREMIMNINIRAREYGLNYNKFMYGLKKLGIKLNRKTLRNLAVEGAEEFKKLIEEVKEKIGS
jgi:large subunit ribosomal protein L20